MFNVIPASSGVLLPFFLLQDPQQVIKLVHLFVPPLDFGITWSIVKFFGDPQYEHL
jgi:hypothetical protein